MLTSRRREFQNYFFALVGHEVALNLRSIAGNQDMASDVATMLKAVWNTDLGYEHNQHLSLLVIKGAPGVDI